LPIKRRCLKPSGQENKSPFRKRRKNHPDEEPDGFHLPKAFE
jgi:hypothetical protein